MTPRCGLIVYPAYAKPYPCIKNVIVNGMCRTHAKVMKKRLARVGLTLQSRRKVRSDKGIGILTK